ncbi:hypothetical protein FOA52_007771 [Chlamydomonas sp. UWO 241]|nr:hypothetical protein FOA52_007771 [Chlamydomonas sp. UWO 241]
MPNTEVAEGYLRSSTSVGLPRTPPRYLDPTSTSALRMRDRHLSSGGGVDPYRSRGQSLPGCDGDDERQPPCRISSRSLSEDLINAGSGIGSGGTPASPSAAGALLITAPGSADDRSFHAWSPSPLRPRGDDDPREMAIVAVAALQSSHVSLPSSPRVSEYGRALAAWEPGKSAFHPSNSGFPSKGVLLTDVLECSRESNVQCSDSANVAEITPGRAEPPSARATVTAWEGEPDDARAFPRPMGAANNIENPLFVHAPPSGKPDKVVEEPRRRRTCCGVLLTWCCCLSLLLALLLAAVTIAAVVVAVLLNRAHDSTTLVVMLGASDSTCGIQGQELLSEGLSQLTYTSVIWDVDPAVVAAFPGLYDESMRDDIAAMFSDAQRRSLLSSGFVLDSSRVQIDSINIDLAPGSATPVVVGGVLLPGQGMTAIDDLVLQIRDMPANVNFVIHERDTEDGTTHLHADMSLHSATAVQQLPSPLPPPPPSPPPPSPAPPSPSPQARDIGVWPTDLVVGFPPGEIIGDFYRADAEGVAARTNAALTVAFNDAASRTLCSDHSRSHMIMGDLDGKTLLPGLYKSPSVMDITLADLTLDAQGDPDAIWIFQMGTTLTITAYRKVLLSNGANVKNVFWQVGTSATLAIASVLQGTVMADQSITAGASATATGRVLARAAAVTVDAAKFSLPDL